ncbi:MAG: TonB-dependent receptor [Bacteroidales bacterium]
MKTKIFSILILAFMGIPYSLFSQTIKIIDKSDLQAISNVSITNKSKSFVASTDNKGNADISKLPKSDSLYITHIAYQPVVIAYSEINKNNIVKLTDNAVKLDEVVLSANKIEQPKSNIPNKIEVISSKQIAFNNPQTSADMLANTGNVYIQQSQMGGGSAILRGFEANRVLLVVDGVRMNNAIYRSGHLQSVITVDPNVLEKTEVLFGPGSVIYGSDAIGGVMHFYTKNPRLSNNDKIFITGNVFTRYSSANTEKAGGFTLNIGSKKWGSLTSISYKDLGDLTTGSVRNPFYGNWGKCLLYPERINGVDSMLVNSKYNLQKNTGYSQYDILQKILFKPNASGAYILNLQYSNSSDIPRYDRLVPDATGKAPYAEWYYGPQTRAFGSLKASYIKEKGFFNTADITAAYQNISEDRIQRKFGKSSKEYREETVDVISLNVDMSKNLTKINKLVYGLEVVNNKVKSVAYAENIKTSEITKNISSRYPDNGSTMSSYAAFLSHNWEIGEKINFSQGVRYSYITMNSEYSDTMMAIMKFPFDKKIVQKNGAFNGSLGLAWKPGCGWNVSLLGSSGFRVPNVDDLTKVNDSKGKSQLLVVPNPDLKPEYAYNADLTIGKLFSGNILVEGTVFYTLLKNAIAAKPFKFNGQDSIMYDGFLCQVQANVNYGNANVYGAQANIKAQITKTFSINSNLTYTYGRIVDNDMPFDHIPPIFGKTSFKLEIDKFKSEFYVRYAGWKKVEDYNITGEDNFTTATVNGLPSWYTLNIMTGYQINKFISLQAGLENIMDVHYRAFASGVSAPGRNLIVALRGNF